MKERLTDPYSAHFSDEFVIQKQVSNGKDTGQSISVCGFVNSKNVLGGYTGKRHFITRTIAPWNKKPSSVNLEDDVMRSAAVSDHNPKPSLYEDIYWNRDCVDEKHPPTYTGQ